MNSRTLARGLGWFSIGLGLAEVFATGPLGRFLGMEDHGTLLRFYGLRELAAGVGLLAMDRVSPWLWARVAGDAVDLATLGMAFRGKGSPTRNLSIATGAVAGVTALDLVAGRRTGGLRRAESAAAAAL